MAQRSASTPTLAERLDLIASVDGVGLRTAVAILVRMPEIGRVTREQAAALAGLAPYDDDSGEHVGMRHIDGGRERLRRSLYAAALPAAFHWNPSSIALYRRLIAAGKPHKVALVACARKLLIYVNTVVERGTPWVKNRSLGDAQPSEGSTEALIAWMANASDAGWVSRAALPPRSGRQTLDTSPQPNTTIQAIKAELKSQPENSALLMVATELCINSLNLPRNRGKRIVRAYTRLLECDMDMSVTPSLPRDSESMLPDVDVVEPRAGYGPNSSDLDIWLQKAEAMGELKRITAEVDPDLEMATIAFLVGSEKSPALLFENIKGHPGHRALYNMIGCNLSRFCLMIGEEPVDHPLKAVRILQQKMGRKSGPREVKPEQAICSQNIVTGDDIDIRKFPAQRMWPLDGGKYLGTGDAVVTRDPETGRINVGTYRMMIKGPREIGVYTSPGKDATIDREKWWKMGKPMPIAAAYGIDPLLFLVAATSFPKTESEYEYYCGINGAPIELFTSDLTGLPLPARAEIILEGFVYPDEPSPKGRSASSPAITGVRAGRRPTCGWSACAIATIPRSLAL